MKCNHCGSSRLVFVPEEDDRHDEPGHAAFMECWDCGASNDIDDDDSMADYRIELNKEKAA